LRLAHLCLERFGPFERLDLPLDPRPGCVNVVVAPNGFGKSVLRSAVGSLLFGIPNRTPMGFRHGTEGMRITADVVTVPNGPLRLVRRKGHGNTLSLADGTSVPPDEYSRLIGGANRAVFDELFGLDTALLRSGGQELIQSRGRIGQVLFAAGGGMERVRKLLEALGRDRDELGNVGARHKSRPIWGALSAYDQAKADLRRASLRPDALNRADAEAAEAARRLAQLLEEQDAEAAERDRLRTVGAVSPWLVRLHEADAALDRIGMAPELEPGFEARWRKALEDGARCASALKFAATAMEDERAARAALSFDPAWLDAADRIEAMAELAGRASGAETDLPGVRASLAQADGRCSGLRRDLGWGVAVEPPSAAAVSAAQQQLRSYPSLSAKAAAAEEARAELEDGCEALEVRIAALPTQADPAGLAGLVEEARLNGDPAARIEAARRRLREGGSALASALAAVPDRPMTDAGLDATAAPSDVRLDAMASSLLAAESSRAGSLRARSSRASEMQAAQSDLDALCERARLPRPGALTEARSRRDALWTDLNQGLPERAPPGLIVEVDRAMRDADTAADALIALGREMAEAEALRGRLAGLQAEMARDEEAVGRASEVLAGARADLAAVAARAGSDASDMPAFRAFLRARAMAGERLRERDAAAAELLDEEAGQRALSGRIAEALGAPQPRDAELGTLLAKADGRIEAARGAAASRAALERQLEEQRSTLMSRTRAAGRAGKALADWQDRWADLSYSLGRPEDEEPVVASEMLAKVEELRAAEEGRLALQGRIDAMEQASNLLAAAVADLGRLAPEAAGLTAPEGAAVLIAGLAAERGHAARCRDADGRVIEAEARRAVCDAEAEAAGLALEGMRAALAAATDEEAEDRIQRARVAGDARRSREEALEQIAVQGGGLPLDDLGILVSETSADAGTARMRAIEATHAERGAEIERLRQDQAEGAARLASATSTLDAAEAAQRREAAQAALTRCTHEALVLHAQHSLLQAALDRRAAAAEQTLLRRIGEVFRAITGGVYAGVAVEDAGAGPTMVALEADGTTRKQLDQLSEGTCDQLYLALRIAALEDYAAAAPPLPFIVDDVLQTFDDPRTAATLRALLELSRHVQVIALTHHPHVGVLAAALPEGAAHTVRLPS
jgi:uncharacterized protein YhaN